MFKVGCWNPKNGVYPGIEVKSGARRWEWLSSRDCLGLRERLEPEDPRDSRTSAWAHGCQPAGDAGSLRGLANWESTTKIAKTTKEGAESFQAILTRDERMFENG